MSGREGAGIGSFLIHRDLCKKSGNFPWVMRLRDVVITRRYGIIRQTLQEGLPNMLGQRKKQPSLGQMEAVTRVPFFLLPRWKRRSGSFWGCPLWTISRMRPPFAVFWPRGDWMIVFFFWGVDQRAAGLYGTGPWGGLFDRCHVG